MAHLELFTSFYSLGLGRALFVYLRLVLAFCGILSSVELIVYRLEVLVQRVHTHLVHDIVYGKVASHSLKKYDLVYIFCVLVRIGDFPQS